MPEIGQGELKAEWLELRPDSDGEFDELVARFADGMVHAEMMDNKSLYIGIYLDDGRLCQWWIHSKSKLKSSVSPHKSDPPRFTAQGVDTKAGAAFEAQQGAGEALRRLVAAATVVSEGDYGRTAQSELRAAILASKGVSCCEGGPQWGHAWSCPKCPD